MNETQKPQTIQDYFNIAWQHAVVEKQPPSVLWGEVCAVKRCLYRTPDGKNCCLIGRAISDRDYNSRIEGLPASTALKQIYYPVPPEKYQDAGEYLIDLLQKCHDKLTIGYSSQEKAEKNYRTKIEDTLREYAMTYGLQIPGATNETATS